MHARLLQSLVFVGCYTMQQQRCLMKAIQPGPALDCVSGQQRGTSMGHVLECVYLKASFWCSVWWIPLPPAQQGEHLRGSALETKPIPEPGVQWRWKQTSAMPQNRRVPNKLVVLFLTSFIRTNITPTMREQQDTAQTSACLPSSASGWEGLGGWGVEGSVCACVWGWGGAKPLRVTQMYIFPNVVETRYIFSLKSYVEFNVMRIFFTAIFLFFHFHILKTQHFCIQYGITWHNMTQIIASPKLNFRRVFLFLPETVQFLCAYKCHECGPQTYFTFECEFIAAIFVSLEKIHNE